MSEALWTVELHSHTVYSKDSLLKLDQIPTICQEKGIDRLAITDHNTAQAGLQLARMYPMLIIPGIEIMTTHGEILGWYVQETIPKGMSPQETIERLREQGAVIGVPHPFDRHRRGAWKLEDLLPILKYVDAIEVFNARCLHQADNDQALAFAKEQQKLMSVGSDGHIASEYGQATLRVAPFANNAEGLRSALQQAHREASLSSAFVHFGSTYAKWVKRIFPSLRPS